MSYIIRDWANNICFHGKEFASFEDAWGFIRETESEDAWPEYVVEGDGADTESEYYDWRSDVESDDETGDDK